ncbi:TetR/AcrR family transcriptional regulator [Slackia isoflavoniconvertens]|uniref:TetR/AcrR family transcriptional regulator n=1 Tax=Slackia isoflavoniconvertens TaxID=572010 RepID=UPI003AF01AE6
MATPTNTENSEASAPLTPEIIYAKALEIADEEGIENASARKIATALGKTPMALYRHCASISDIQQGACALAFSEVDTTPIPGERWDDTVRRTTASIRAMKVRHARACLFKIKGTALSPALRAHTERVQKLHHDQGIPQEILERFWRIVDAFLSGFMINEVNMINALHDDEIRVPVDAPNGRRRLKVPIPTRRFMMESRLLSQVFVLLRHLTLASGIHLKNRRKRAEAARIGWRLASATETITSV